MMALSKLFILLKKKEITKSTLTPKGEDIHKSPFHAKAKPEVDKSKLKAHGRGLHKATTTKPAAFTVEVKDKDGHAVEHSNEEVIVEIKPKSEHNKPVEPVDVKEQKPGINIVSYHATEPGDYDVHVKHDDHPIEGSPFALHVIEGPDKSKITAHGPGLTKASTTVPAKFVIDVLDKDGKPVSGIPEDLQVLIVPNKEGAEPIVGTVGPDNGDGKYPVSYKVPEDGDYKVYVKHDDENVPDAPFPLKVRKGASKSTTATWAITMVARDDEGNICDDPDDIFDVRLEGPAPVEVTIKNKGHGVFNVKYAPKVYGEYTVHITLNGEYILNSPFKQTL